MSARIYFENRSERYGEIVKVTIEDYRELNPAGDFRQTWFAIYEHDENGDIIEQVAVITMSSE